jgi:hypothetical protein
MFYTQKSSVVSLSIVKILPFFSVGLNGLKKIIVTNYLLDKSYYVEIGDLFGKFFLCYNYGVYFFLSHLFINCFGLQLRTRYYFFSYLFEFSNIVFCFPLINKLLFQHSFFFLKKKFDSHSYWSTLYLHKYPIRGQRRRTNASTAKKLNMVYRFNNTTMN